MTFPTNKYEICKTLNGNQTYFFRCVGFCSYHKVYVTVKQAKFKKCAAKHCSAMIRTDHPYWREREIKKQLRKIRKSCGNLQLKDTREEPFTIRCAEIYADYVKRSLSSVYEQFFTTGLHEHLTTKETQLVAMSKDEIVGLCDDWIQSFARNNH